MKAFRPKQSYAITVTATASTPLAVTGGNELLLTNFGTQLVHVTVSSASTSAVAATGTATNSFPILPNSKLILNINDPSFVSAVATAVGSTLYVTTGAGDIA